MANHVLDSDTAGVYAATTVAAKFVVWIAVGIGFWVLPEATRRAAAGRDPRPVLLRALGGHRAAVGARAGHLRGSFPTILLRIAFGADYESGDAVLLPLGVAFALLAVTYVSVQFLLGLHRRAFVLWLGVVAIAEPLLLYNADSLETFASRVLIVQAVGALAVVGAAALTRRAASAGGETAPARE